MPVTPLTPVHERLGASFTDFAGWRMPLRYRGDIVEHQAVRGAAGLFDLSHMGEISVLGARAGDALDYALVGHASAIGVGRARYTMICAPDGGVLDDLIVYRLTQQRYLVVANAANSGVVAAALAERAAGFPGVTVSDDSERYALIAIQGPRSAQILATLTDVDLATVKYYASYRCAVAGHDVLLARTGYTGEDGFELFTPPDHAVALWTALSRAGEPHGLLPAGLSCRDTLRLEAGMPLYGNELTRELTPYHAGLGRVVKLDKPGDFVGRAALEAIADKPMPVTLAGLVAQGRRAPRHGYAVLHPDSGARLGVVTSGAPSPTLRAPIAMAYLPPDQAEPGAKLAVDVRGSAEPVEVVALPFYRRP